MNWNLFLTELVAGITHGSVYALIGQLFTVGHVTAFEVATTHATSQREYARAHDVPRTTLQHWLARKGSLDASPTMVAWSRPSLILRPTAF